MWETPPKTLSWAAGCLTAAFILCAACHAIQGETPQNARSSLALNRVVVAGFHPRIPSDGEAKIARSPLTGSVFLGEPVSRQVARDLTDRLFDMLVERGDYELISPDQAGTVYPQLLFS
jgi:hypothetical protein